MEENKCPHCGAKENDMKARPAGTPGLFRMECQVCGACGPIAGGKDEALEFWTLKRI